MVLGSEARTEASRSAGGVIGSAEEQLRLLLTGVRDHAMFLLSPEGVIQAWNVGAEQIKGYSAAEVVGHHFSVFYTPEAVAAGEAEEALRLAAEQGRHEQEGWRLRSDGSRFWANVVITAVRNESGELAGFAKITRDLTEAKAAEIRERELIREQAARAEAEAAAARMRVLADTSRILSSSLDISEGLRQLTRLLVPELADWCAVHLAAEDGLMHRVEVSVADPMQIGLAEELERHYPSDAPRSVGIYSVLRTGEPLLIEEFSPEMLERVAEDERHVQILREIGLRSVLIVPLVGRGRAMGTVTMLATRPGRRYGATELALAEDLAARAALALDNTRLYCEARAELEARTRIELELSEARARIEVILRNVRSGITVQDPTGRLVYANDAAARLIGFPTARELLEAAISDVVGRFEIADEWGAPLPVSQLPGRKALRGEEGPERLLRYRVTATGEEHWSLACSAPVLDELGEVQLAVNVFHDVTERIRTEQALRENAQRLQELTTELETTVEKLQAQTEVAESARRAAEQANRAKGDFLATMSHELRTPLNAIIGYADLLELGVSGPLTEGQARQLGRITVGAKHLLHLIDELLTFSKIEAGRLEVRVDVTDLTELLRETAELIAPLAEEKRLAFRLDLPNHPVAIDTDERKLRQVLINLLGNAVKFTDQGEVRLSASLEEREAVISVADTGIGISAEDMERVFEPFSQLEQAPSRRAQGTGLGLSVSRQLTQLLGGEIEVESKPGLGSTFSVRLPVRWRERPEAEAGR